MKIRTIALAVVLAAVVAAPFAVNLLAQKVLRGLETAQVQQRERLRQIRMENERLSSNLVVNAKNTQDLSPAELQELMKLRAEYGLLRDKLGETNELARENRQIRGGLRAVEAESEMSEMERREARANIVKAWLENNPDEKIPELKFLPEKRWTEIHETPATDDDYQGQMAVFRGAARARYSKMISQALKDYTKANNGQFPTDVSQLAPYFENPTDAEMLSGYKIVPAKSLIYPLSAADREWVITQKAPINRKYEVRFAIGRSGVCGSTEPKSW